MLKNHHIPVLTDLIEKQVEVKLPRPGLDTSQDLTLDVDERNEPSIDVPLELNNANSPDPVSDNPALEQAIRSILDDHIELAWQEIKQVIQQTNQHLK